MMQADPSIKLLGKDLEFAFLQYRRILAMNQEDRKRTLMSFPNFETWKFRSNGKDVCERFLARAIKFPACIQSWLKVTDGACTGLDLRTE